MMGTIATPAAFQGPARTSDPYADLPEHSKRCAREQVARYWPLIVAFVGDWLEQASPEDFARNTPAEIWREDMA